MRFKSEVHIKGVADPVLSSSHSNTDSLVLPPPKTCLLCFPGKVQGLLYQVLHLMRVRDSSPMLMTLWAALPFAKVRSPTFIPSGIDYLITLSLELDPLYCLGNAKECFLECCYW